MGYYRAHHFACHGRTAVGMSAFKRYENQPTLLSSAPSKARARAPRRAGRGRFGALFAAAALRTPPFPLAGRTPHLAAGDRPVAGSPSPLPSSGSAGRRSGRPCAGGNSSPENREARQAQQFPSNSGIEPVREKPGAELRLGAPCRPYTMGQPDRGLFDGNAGSGAH